MFRILLAWVGQSDLNGRSSSAQSGVGPIAQALDAREFDEVRLLSNYPEEESTSYLEWLRARTSTPIQLKQVSLTSPTDYGEVHTAALAACESAMDSHRGTVRLTFHLSPGTPAMQAMWIILGKTRFPAELLESSRQRGVQTASVPFDLAAEYVPDAWRVADAQVRYGAAATPPEAAGFEDILYRSEEMDRVVDLARRVSRRDVPVLIEGASGTGKELFARAIHRASPRRLGPFVAVNCGAISADLVDSELFGHRSGAFTGAVDRRGHFESAHGGTLFLDEIGELPLAIQVKLLRVLQEGEVVRVGESVARPVDVRIVAATNRSLVEEVTASRFREDLFYRLAVAMLVLPPVRQRTGDVGLLLDGLLEKVNAEFADDRSCEPKTLAPGARQVFLDHSWPGNVREMHNTIRRVVLWCRGSVISAEDAKAALLPRMAREEENRWERPIGEGFSLPDLLGEVAREYLQRALAKTGGNKSKAARLVGLPSQQTFSNWLDRYIGDSGSKA